MDDREKQRRVGTFASHCHDLGLPFTSQRRMILEAVLDLDNHPSADQVHERVARRLPGISRATVYRTLETLVRLGVITKACHPGHVVRYDRRTDVHHHLICMHCDEVADISDDRLDSIPLPDTTGLGFEIADHRVQLRGICQTCREKEEGS